MYINDDIIRYGGTLEPTEETKFWVSLWYNTQWPEYDDARVVLAFFAKEEETKKFKDRYQSPPEMASLSAYDDNAKKNYAEMQAAEKGSNDNVQ